MSKQYRDVFGIVEARSEEQERLRLFSKRPGCVDDEGNIMYKTEQHHKDECDINHIIRKYDKTGLISHVSRFEGQFGNVSGIDFRESMDQINNAQAMFNELPSNIRKRFGNNAANLLEFMDDGQNRTEAIALGLIRADWTEDSDGLGEHVPEGQNKKIPDEPAPE